MNPGMPRIELPPDSLLFAQSYDIEVRILDSIQHLADGPEEILGLCRSILEPSAHGEKHKVIRGDA
jgi:hypothetical protein